MDVFISITLLLTVSFCLWTTESRQYISELHVPNGGPWGEWGTREFCSTGHARGFQLKVSRYIQDGDEMGLTAIALICPDKEYIYSSYEIHGSWSKQFICPSGYLNSFSLRVQPYQGKGDDTAANNIQFKCSDGTILVGDGLKHGEFGPWSATCPEYTFICGIQTKLEPYQWFDDDTALNDAKFYCC